MDGGSKTIYIGRNENCWDSKMEFTTATADERGFGTKREGEEGGDRIAVSRSKYEGRRGGVYRSPSNRITLNYTGKINS